MGKTIMGVFHRVGRQRGSGARRAVGAATLAALTALAIPATATAAPKPAAPRIDKATLDSLGSFVPAIIGSAATPGPDGKVNGALLRQAGDVAHGKNMPPQVTAIWTQITKFLDGTATPTEVAKVAAANNRSAGAPAIPTGPDAPRIQQFLYPTVAPGCIPDGVSVGAALATAGPQEAPAPGPKAGQAGLVFTSLGTGPALDNSRAPLTAIWINIDTGKSGQIDLKRNEKINVAKGPGTFTAIAPTGKGRVLTAVYGTVTTEIKNKPVSCQIVPTVGLAFI